MNRNQLIRSLVNPAIIVISGILWIIFFWTVSRNIFFGGIFNSAIPMICGGIISAFLTMKFKVDTSRYFNMKIIFSIISIFTFTIPTVMEYAFILDEKG